MRINIRFNEATNTVLGVTPLIRLDDNILEKMYLEILEKFWAKSSKAWKFDCRRVERRHPQPREIFWSVNVVKLSGISNNNSLLSLDLVNQKPMT